MHVKTFLLLFIIAVTIAKSNAEVPPNIVLMMADDMGMGDTSAYQDFTGNSDEAQVFTPNMERLARMGIRFTDAHTPSSRCSPTRYGLLTGRYPWRNRLKHWVLFGAQGDPMIEADRPTIASMLKQSGYKTAMVGKWHVGLRYRRSDGKPAAGWEDADLMKPLHTTPIDHGFDFARFTSRSHGTSGPDPAFEQSKRKKNANAKRKAPKSNQRGPGHIHGRIAVAAIGGRKLKTTGPDAYVLTKLGSRHSDHAIEHLEKHVGDEATNQKPFFLYYAANSNHGPYTPDTAIGGKKVKGAARTKSGASMDARHDFIYENDLALGRLIDWLENTDDARRPGKKLLENTLVIFTSDNGAEIKSKVATGPFRSNKGSVYEGGHRVPFIASWPIGKIGDGDVKSDGNTSDFPIGLQDLYATFAEIADSALPNNAQAEKGAEDSFSVLAALRDSAPKSRPPLFFNDHNEAVGDRAVAAIRIDSPNVNGKVIAGKWKLFLNAKLLRSGVAVPIELYNLAADQMEASNLIGIPKHKVLVEFMVKQAALHRNAGGHRLVDALSENRVQFRWDENGFSMKSPVGTIAMDIQVTVGGVATNGLEYTETPQGLGIDSGKGDANRVDSGEGFSLTFNEDVVVESVELVAGDGTCGGYYRIGDGAPLAIYCVDADNDAKDQQGNLSDIGMVKKGTALHLSSAPHFGTEPAGAWTLRAVNFSIAK